MRKEVEEFKYLEVLFASDERREPEIDRWVAPVCRGEEGGRGRGH